MYLSTSTAMQPTSEAHTGEVRAGLVLGRYELLVPIASGGMAQVWAARLRGARQFQKLVAVKTMLPKLSEDEQFEQMFLDEASLASQIRHPNAVEIMDLGEHNGVLYLVMEFIEGVPLNQLMKAAKHLGGLPPKVAARIALQACAGLHAAHELKDEKGQLVGLVHRDVSPQNLLVTYDGVTKVVDFGVAKATALGGGATTAGQVKGKVSYMAPEQINGEGLDRRADVFAMGIVLYALTTGKHPFRRESEAATMYNICSPEPVVAPSKVNPEFPKELEPIVLKALEKDRDKRYSSCDEVLRALDSLPPELRVSSDGDIAAFVSEVMGDRRAEQRKRIEDAIIRADSAIESGVWSGTDMASGVQGRQSTPTTGSFELTGVPRGLHPLVFRNRLLGIAGLVALAVVGSVLTTLVLSEGAPAPELRMLEAPEPPPEAPSTAARAETETVASLSELEEVPDPSESGAKNGPDEDATKPATGDSKATPGKSAAGTADKTPGPTKTGTTGGKSSVKPTGSGGTAKSGSSKSGSTPSGATPKSETPTSDSSSPPASDSWKFESGL